MAGNFETAVTQKVTLLSNPHPHNELIVALAVSRCVSAVDTKDLWLAYSAKDSEHLGKIIARAVESGHDSVLEHAQYVFGVDNVSRSLLAQLTRHRLASESVQSQRYVKFKAGVPVIVPPSIRGASNELQERWARVLEMASGCYTQAINEGIEPEDARYILTEGTATKLIFSCNARELRHIVGLRSCSRAQWEIQTLAWAMAKLVREADPIIGALMGAQCDQLGYCPEKNSCGNVRALVESE